MAVKKKKKKITFKKFFKYMGIFFAALLLLVFLINLITPTRSFSEKENRVLSSRPEISWAQISSGQFQEKFETYVNDQFVLRDFWVTFKANVDLILGKRESNGVYLGRKSYLMEAFKAPKQEDMDTTLQSMKKYRERYPDIEQVALIAPTSVSINAAYLPKSAPVDDQNAYIDQLQQSLTDSNIRFVDIRKSFKEHQKEDLYYHTDHHWTTLGAYYAFIALGKELGVDTGKYSYKSSVATEDFQGTLSAKTGFLSNKKEEILVYLPKDDAYPRSVINYVDEQKKSASFYATKNLLGRDKYSLFFDSNHAQVKISTTVDNTETLLIFKDSYANCLVPFLAPYYHKIIMIDPRYYYGNIDTLMESENVTQILYLYNANTFSGDTSLYITLDTE